MPSFRSLLNLGDFDLDDTSYERQCHVQGVREAMNVVDDLGLSYDNRLAPVALFLRSGEAYDAVQNFIHSADTAETPSETAAYVLCGLMNLGGVLYLSMLLPLLLAALVCVPFLSACGVFLYATCCCCFRTTSSVAIAEVTAAAVEAGVAAPRLVPFVRRRSPLYASVGATTPEQQRAPSPTSSARSDTLSLEDSPLDREMLALAQKRRAEFSTDSLA